MAERDAFGREKNDDPVQSMGWGPSGTASRPREQERVEVRLPTNEGLPGMGDPGSGGPGIGVPDMDGVPGTRARPGHTFPEHRATPTVPGSASDGVRVAGRGLAGCLPALVVLIVVGAIGIGVIGAIVDSVEDSGIVDAIDSIDDVDRPAPVSPEGPATPAPAGEPGAAGTPPESPAPALSGPPTGFRSDSLLLRRNFRAALEQIPTADGVRIEMLRVAPEQINAMLRGSDGRRIIVLVGSDRSVQRITSAGQSGIARDRTAPVSSVNTAAPYRASRSAAGRSRLPASSVNYLLYNFAGSRGWNVYLKNGDFYQADERGQITRRFSTR